MGSAWTTRRESLEGSPEQRREALARARTDLTTAVELLSSEANPATYAHAVHLLANIELDDGDEARALSLWEEAVSVLRRTDELLQLAHKIRHLGDLHRNSGRLTEADRHYAEALSLYREHDRPGSLDFANAVRRVAVLKEQQGERDQALSLWHETRDLYAAVDMPPGVEEADAHIFELTAEDGS